MTLAAVLVATGALFNGVTSTVGILAALSVSTFGVGIWAGNLHTLPNDAFPRNIVATVHGLAGSAGAVGRHTVQHNGGLLERIRFVCCRLHFVGDTRTAGADRHVAVVVRTHRRRRPNGFAARRGRPCPVSPTLTRSSSRSSGTLWSRQPKRCRSRCRGRPTRPTSRHDLITLVRSSMPKAVWWRRRSVSPPTW